eukprot:scaffold30602_cov66-Phaeocystis_antarctica.AAC.3
MDEIWLTRRSARDTAADSSAIRGAPAGQRRKTTAVWCSRSVSGAFPGERSILFAEIPPAPRTSTTPGSAPPRHAQSRHRACRMQLAADLAVQRAQPPRAARPGRAGARPAVAAPRPRRRAGHAGG